MLFVSYSALSRTGKGGEVNSDFSKDMLRQDYLITLVSCPRIMLLSYYVVTAGDPEAIRKSEAVESTSNPGHRSCVQGRFSHVSR